MPSIFKECWGADSMMGMVLRRTPVKWSNLPHHTYSNGTI